MIGEGARARRSEGRAGGLSPEPSPAPSRGAREARKLATRARILAVARAQLERDGFEATHIRGVAAEAGVSSGTVLLHFRDKQDLLHAALFDDLERTWQAARAAAKGRALERELVALASAFFDYYLEREALSRALLARSLFAAPPWSERFAGQVAEVGAHVTELARAARARGELDPTLDPTLTAAAFLSFYYLALLAWCQRAQPPLPLFRKLLAQHLRRSPTAPRRRSARGSVVEPVEPTDPAQPAQPTLRESPE